MSLWVEESTWKQTRALIRIGGHQRPVFSLVAQFLTTSLALTVFISVTCSRTYFGAQAS